MTNVGQRERITQNRVVKLFQETLHYDYLGNWQDREGNSNIEEEYLAAYLERRGYSNTLIRRALYVLHKAAGDQSKSLYDVNKAVYGLLRYGAKIKPEAGKTTDTVWLIDWKNPLNNHFAIAEEVSSAPLRLDTFMAVFSEHLASPPALAAIGLQTQPG